MVRSAQFLYIVNKRQCFVCHQKNNGAMIKTRVLLGLLAGFAVGAILGALFSVGDEKKSGEKKAVDEKPGEAEDDVVIKY